MAPEVPSVDSCRRLSQSRPHRETSGRRFLKACSRVLRSRGGHGAMPAARTLRVGPAGAGPPEASTVGASGSYGCGSDERGCATQQAWRRKRALAPVSNWLAAWSSCRAVRPHTRRRHLGLPECERVRLGTGLEKRDLQRALADRVVLAHELVQATVQEQAVPVLVDVQVSLTRRTPRRRGACG